jgi:hypothetical protein
MAFMRTPSPPLRKSHHTIVSVARAAPASSVAHARVAQNILRIMSIPSQIVADGYHPPGTRFVGSIRRREA